MESFKWKPNPEKSSITILPNGVGPFSEWMKSLRDRQARAKIHVRIDRLQTGNFGGVRSIGSGLSELRVDVGPGYRVYFGQIDEVVVLLLCGGDKTTQTKDIVIAKAYWEDHKRRSKPCEKK